MAKDYMEGKSSVVGPCAVCSGPTYEVIHAGGTEMHIHDRCTGGERGKEEVTMYLHRMGIWPDAAARNGIPSHPAAAEKMVQIDPNADLRTVFKD